MRSDQYMRAKSFEHLSVTLLICISLPLVALSSCRQGSTDEAIFKASTAYNVALLAAVKYAQLPRCVPSGPRVCSEQATVDKIRAASDVAFVAVHEAEKIARDPTATETRAQVALSSAQAALATLTALTLNLPTLDGMP